MVELSLISKLNIASLYISNYILNLLIIPSIYYSHLWSQTCMEFCIPRRTRIYILFNNIIFVSYTLAIVIATYLFRGDRYDAINNIILKLDLKMIRYNPNNIDIRNKLWFLIIRYSYVNEDNIQISTSVIRNEIPDVEYLYMCYSYEANTNIYMYINLIDNMNCTSNRKLFLKRITFE